MSARFVARWELAGVGVVVVAIDVLRAFTTAAYALAGGAREIRLVAGVDEAIALGRSIPGALVMGEEHGRRPDGFDLSNSPVAVTKANVDGRVPGRHGPTRPGPRRIATYCSTMVGVQDKPLVSMQTVGEWEAFLDQHQDSDGVRLKLRKKASTLPGITYAEALDAALCFGWIDGQRGSLDDDYHVQVFTPRRPRSIWSQRNRDHVERLTAQGRMRASGQAQIDRAKADGRWDAAYRWKDAEVPPDLQEAIDARPAAAAFFAQLSSQNRFAIIFRLGNVKRADTRARKITTFVAMLERGETLHPQKRGE